MKENLKVITKVITPKLVKSDHKVIADFWPRFRGVSAAEPNLEEVASCSTANLPQQRLPAGINNGRWITPTQQTNNSDEGLLPRLLGRPRLVLAILNLHV